LQAGGSFLSFFSVYVTVMDKSLWKHLPGDLVVEVVKHVEDLDVRRAFGIYGRLSDRQKSLNFHGKRVETGYLTSSDWYVRWEVGEKVYRHCKDIKTDKLSETVCVTSDRIYTVVWEHG
jgi:hypothetical protein